MNKFLKTFFSFALIFLITFSSVLAEPQNEEALYSAVTTSRLKLRQNADPNSFGIDSIPENTRVDIIELGKEFFKVRYRNYEGYVIANRFRDFRVKSINFDAIMPSDDSILESNNAKSEIVTPNDEFNMNEGFVPRYVAKPTDTLLLYTEPNDKSRSLTSIPRYTFDLELSQIKGNWAMVRYNDKVGFIKIDSLVQYDFLDPYAERFPGITKYQYAAILPGDTVLYDQLKPGKTHKTIPGGAVVSVEDAEEPGYMHVAYMKRRHALIKKDDIIATERVIPYDKAEKGDLISVFTTFFPVHNSNLYIIGRIYNMFLAGDKLSGIILQPNEELSMNNIMGPYKKSTGYMPAPIASKTVDYGYGGGTCQVNTTMYNTLLQVPILVKHRRVHSRSGAVYAPVGFDAAVGSLSTIDMIFKNTLSYPVLIEYDVSDNVITCLIYRAD